MKYRKKWTIFPKNTPPKKNMIICTDLSFFYDSFVAFRSPVELCLLSTSSENQKLSTEMHFSTTTEGQLRSSAFEFCLLLAKTRTIHHQGSNNPAPGRSGLAQIFFEFQAYFC